MPRRFSLYFLLALAVPASAQAPTGYERAVAAGYKALTLCSAMFNAGRTEAQVEQLELKGIYPEYDSIVPTLPAGVDSKHGTITVAFDPALPPRRALWSAQGGCTILPIGGASSPASGPASSAAAAGSGPPAAPAGPDPRPWPTGDSGRWTLAPESRVQTRLQAVAGHAFDGGYGKDSQTTAVIVVRRGQVDLETYREGFGPFTAQRTWSVAKSLSGTLIGIASGLGAIDVARPAPIPEWRHPGDPRGAITTNQLLRMASGLHSGAAGNRTDAVYFGGAAVTEEVVAWPLEAAPGTRFRYANDDILLAIRGLRAKLADERAYAAFPRERLFARIGMTHTIAERDWQGNFILSSQVWSTARDLARFGMLYLADGMWNGERILPKGWVRYVTTPSGPQPEGAFGYGATFWLLNHSPGVPADSFAAFGNRGQYVVIVPSRSVVIVRRGEDPGNARFDIAKFTADALAALD